VIAHPLALQGGVGFIPFTYVIVVSPMAQFFPRDLLRWIKREWVKHRGVELRPGYVPAISNTLQGFKKEVAGDRHERFVTYMRNDRNWAQAERPLSQKRSNFGKALGFLKPASGAKAGSDCHPQKVKSVSIGQLTTACLADDPPDNNAASEAC